MPRSRVAVVLLVPPPFSDRLDAVRAAVGDASLARVAPHLTLVPAVNVNHERMDDAHAVLREAAAATAPLRVRLGPPATFLPQTPVLHLPAVDAAVPPLVDLRTRLFRAPLDRPVDRPFVPHVTIASELAEHRLRSAVDLLAALVLDVTFDRVHMLVEGRRSDGSVVWQPLVDAPFAAAAVVGRGGLELELEVSERPGPEAHAFAEREWALYDAAEFGAVADAQQPVTVTARREGAVVAVARGRVRSGAAHLSELLVDAACRGQGIGSHTLAAFQAEARRRRCDRITVHTAAGSAAEGFYRRHGWTEVARLPRWAFDRDFVRLERSLTP